jgi:hypothetical protein
MRGDSVGENACGHRDIQRLHAIAHRYAQAHVGEGCHLGAHAAALAAQNVNHGPLGLVREHRLLAVGAQGGHGYPPSLALLNGRDGVLAMHDRCPEQRAGGGFDDQWPQCGDAFPRPENAIDAGRSSRTHNHACILRVGDAIEGQQARIGGILLTR